jgi:TIR domain
MAEAAPGEKLKVFVSYSRRDSSEFAEELVAGLELAGFAAFLDRHDIAVGEDWEARLGGLIRQADTVLFVISPAAVKSERCRWEIEATLELSKRLVPVVFKAVPDVDIPEQLSRLQFVRFDTQSGLVRPLAQLASALRQDLDWIREHTRLGELGSRWEARDRPESLLLRGEELVAARAWATKREIDAPEITDRQRTFLNASEAADAARLNKELQQLDDIRRAQEATAASQKRTARVLWVSGTIVAAFLLFTVGLGLFIYSQNKRIESATLRLRAGIKLKIAQTEHIVNATEKWYRVATDSKLSIGVIRRELKTGEAAGTGFLMRGDSLHRKWDTRLVFLTAAHVLRDLEKASSNMVGFTATFPALSNEESVGFEKLVFLSDVLAGC